MDALRIRDVLVCGHYGCRSVRACEGMPHELTDHWLEPTRRIAKHHMPQLGSGTPDEAGLDRLAELNVLKGVRRVCETPILRNASKRGADLTVKGLINGLKDGLLRGLECSVAARQLMPAIAIAGPDFCGCDTAQPSGKLVSVDVALRRGLALAEPVAGTESLPLAAATGRVLAADALSPIPLPPFDNSAMDGYGVRLADFEGRGPWRFTVGGRIAAGDAPPTHPIPGITRILTGAPVPPWMDAVIMQEHVRRDVDAVEICRRPQAGLNIRRAAEDLASGAPILRAGTPISTREAAALASIGMAEAQVRRRLRVSLFCTGSELRQPGEPLGPGQIWNSNRFMLRAALEAPWIELTDLGAIADEPAALTSAFVEASRTADIVVSTGGVSVGDEDHMPRLFREAGGEIHAMRIAMKPGKPLALGRMGGAIYLGLPGNPVSAFVTWIVLGAQLARQRAGFAKTTPRRRIAVAGFALRRRPGRCEFRPAQVTDIDAQGREVIELLSSSFSARVALLASCDGLALLPAQTGNVEAGEMLEFLPLY